MTISVLPDETGRVSVMSESERAAVRHQIQNSPVSIALSDEDRASLLEDVVLAINFIGEDLAHVDDAVDCVDLLEYRSLDSLIWLLNALAFGESERMPSGSLWFCAHAVYALERLREYQVVSVETARGRLRSACVEDPKRPKWIASCREDLAFSQARLLVIERAFAAAARVTGPAEAGA